MLSYCLGTVNDFHWEKPDINGQTLTEFNIVYKEKVTFAEDSTIYILPIVWLSPFLKTIIFEFFLNFKVYMCT